MAWTSLHARLHQTLLKRRLLERNQRLLMAVSGGQDSLCLSKLLLDLQQKWGWELAIAHCDHRWRSDSEANANYVKHLAHEWQVPFYQQIAVQVTKSEAEARHWRYQALTTIALDMGYQYIVTGHTASDRAETLLYNLIRGSGADGLQSLTWQRPLTPAIQLVRPLLEINRAETAQFCQDLQIAIWEDSTNRDLKYARNRIRHELIPYLQDHFNPQAQQALAQTAEILRAEVEYLEQVTQELSQQAMMTVSSGEQHPDRLGVNRLVLRQAPLALQRRVMRRFLQQTLFISPTFEQIEKLTVLINAPNRSRTDPFAGNMVAEVEGDWLWLNLAQKNGMK